MAGRVQEIKTLHELNKEFGIIQKLFQQKESEDNWKERNEKLIRITTLLKSDKIELWRNDIIKGLHSVMPVVVKSIFSLRTVIVSQVSALIEALGKSVGPSLNVYTLNVILLTLLKAGGVAKKCVASIVSRAAIEFISSVSYHTTLLSTLCKVMDEKNNQVRQQSVRCIHAYLTIHASSENENIDKPMIEQYLKKGLQDASADVRSVCRQIYGIYYKHWPNHASNLLSTLDNTTQRLLKKDIPQSAPSNSSSSNSLSSKLKTLNKSKSTKAISPIDKISTKSNLALKKTTPTTLSSHKTTTLTKKLTSSLDKARSITSKTTSLARKVVSPKTNTTKAATVSPKPTSSSESNTSTSPNLNITLDSDSSQEFSTFLSTIQDTYQTDSTNEDITLTIDNTSGSENTTTTYQSVENTFNTKDIPTTLSKPTLLTNKSFSSSKLVLATKRNPPKLPTSVIHVSQPNLPKLPTTTRSDLLKLPIATRSDLPKPPATSQSDPLKLLNATQSDPFKLPTNTQSDPPKLVLGTKRDPPKLPTSVIHITRSDSTTINVTTDMTSKVSTTGFSSLPTNRILSTLNTPSKQSKLSTHTQTTGLLTSARQQQQAVSTFGIKSRLSNISSLSAPAGNLKKRNMDTNINRRAQSDFNQQSNVAAATLLQMLKSQDIEMKSNGIHKLSSILKKDYNYRPQPNLTPLPPNIPNKLELLPVLMDIFTSTHLPVEFYKLLMSWESIGGIFVYVMELHYYAPTLILADELAQESPRYQCLSDGLKRVKMIMKRNDPDLVQRLFNIAYQLLNTNNIADLDILDASVKVDIQLNPRRKQLLEQGLLKWIDELVCDYIGVSEDEDQELILSGSRWYNLTLNSCSGWFDMNSNIRPLMKFVLDQLLTQQSNRNGLYPVLSKLMSSLKMANIRGFENDFNQLHHSKQAFINQALGLDILMVDEKENETILVNSKKRKFVDDDEAIFISKKLK